MPILASLCNAREPVPSCLLLIEEDLSAFRWLALPEGFPPCTGVMGLAVDVSLIYLATQSGHLVAVQREAFSLSAVHTFRVVKDAHSIILCPNGLLVASTGSDSLCRLSLGGGALQEDVQWEVPVDGDRVDRSHINSLCWLDGRVFVSGFGAKEGPFWDSARAGFVLEAASEASVAQGLYHPHSLTAYGGAILVCESGLGGVRSLSDDRRATLEGYTRGLCAIGGTLYVATSVRRLVSRSTGVVFQEEPDPDAKCAVYALDAANFLVRARIMLDELPAEIYDLSVVGVEALSWPTAPWP